MNQAIVIAYLKNGSIQYLHQGNNSKLTPNRRVAWRTSVAIAENTVSRLHRVQAQGRHWQMVLFFDVRCIR